MNIVFAFADDWGRYANIYAQHEKENSINNIISTPNFDRVAKEGVLFRNAFVPAPSCTPCRSSILSGRYFWNTGLGSICDGAFWDENIKSFPLELEKKGYHIGYTYKVWSPGLGYNAPYGGKRTEYIPCGKDFLQFSHVATKRAIDIGVEAAKQELFDETRGNFKAFLDSVPKDKPFCYWWGPQNTHRTWERGSGNKLWDLNPDDFKGRLPEFLPDTHDIREDVCDYIGECQAVDKGIGVLIETLEERGELENTLFIVSGDHGIPGIPRAKCNLYNIGCEVGLAMRWPGRIKEGRVVDDLVNLMDLCPTIMEVAGEEIFEGIDGKSLLPLLLSEKSGQIEEERDFVILGRERHVKQAREGYLPYPQRAIRTKEYLYIINFEPDRWPIGDPSGLDDLEKTPPPFEDFLTNTYIAYSDIDVGPTKAWMIHNRNKPEVRDLFQLSFGKRPYEELYDLKNDQDYMNNIADDKNFDDIKKALNKKLLENLEKYNDPRTQEVPCRFEFSPYAGELQEFQKY